MKRLKSILIQCILILQYFVIAINSLSKFQIKDNKPTTSRFKLSPPSDPVNSQVPDYISSPRREKHEKFLSNVAQIILEHGVFFNEDSPRASNTSMYDFKQPEILSKLIDTSLGEVGASHEQLLEIIRKVIQYSPHPSHRFMLDERVAGLDPYALAADWLISTVNNNLAKFCMSPVFTLIEFEMGRRLSKLFGWASQGEGITTTGAGTANGLALSIALQNKYPELKLLGLVGVGNPKTAIFVSEHASYTWEKAGVYQGIAADWIIKIQTNTSTGRMDPNYLRSEIEQAKRNKLVPLMVVGTAGTPAVGAIDPLLELANICQEYGLWFHVDAEKAGVALFHPKYKLKLDGIHLANSVTFGTWMLATPYVTTMLMVQGPVGRLQSSFGLHAPYLFTNVDLYNSSYDVGDLSVQASRRAEIIKFWYSWKARGLNGLQLHVDKIYENTAIFIQLLKKYGDTFELILSDFDSPQIAFNFIPESVRKIDKNSQSYITTLNKITTDIKLYLLQENLCQLSIGQLKAKNETRHFFVISLTNSVLQESDLAYIINLIKSVGEFKSKSKDGNNKQSLGAITLPIPPPPSSRSSTASVNSPFEADHGKFFKDLFALMLKQGIFFNRNETGYKYMEPQELNSIFDLGRVKQDGMSHEELLKDFETVIKYSPHRGHPYYMFQLVAGFDPYTLAGDWVASALNTPMITYEDSPVFTLMQLNVMKEFRNRIFKTTEGDGVVIDGGSMGNQMAIALARHAKEQRVKLEGIGVSGKQFIGYMSEDAHYSSRKGFILQNLGANNLIEIESNEKGQMIVEKLIEGIEVTLAAGDIPFMVCITVGTTVYGANDPIEPIVEVCAKYKLWCHVDGMFGGLLAMSDIHLPKLKGIDRVDSFGTDFHKLMGSTVVVGALITKESNIFKKVFGINTDNNINNSTMDLYNKEVWDIGHNHIQIDKRNNLFKLWLLMKAKGRKGFEAHVNLIMENTKYLTQQLHARASEGFHPIIPEFELTNVCFVYIPAKLRHLKKDSEGFYNEINTVSFEIEKALTRNDVLHIVAQQRHSAGLTRNNTVVLLKFVMMGSTLTKPDIDYLLDAVAFYGENIMIKR